LLEDLLYVVSCSKSTYAQTKKTKYIFMDGTIS
jgi:hypothetical protein